MLGPTLRAVSDSPIANQAKLLPVGIRPKSPRAHLLFLLAQALLAPQVLPELLAGSTSGSFLWVDELRATQEFLSTPLGHSILRKRHTFKYKMQSILKKELLKVVIEEMERSKRTQRIGSKNYFP